MNLTEFQRIYTNLHLYFIHIEFGKDNPEKRFITDKKNITDDKLIFLKAISNVIKSGMDIVGVSVPEKCNDKRNKIFHFSLIIILFLFFSVKYYFSENNKKNSYRSLNTVDKRIITYAENLPILESDTQNIKEYVDQSK